MFNFKINLINIWTFKVITTDFNNFVSQLGIFLFSRLEYMVLYDWVQVFKAAGKKLFSDPKLKCKFHLQFFLTF